MKIYEISLILTRFFGKVPLLMMMLVVSTGVFAEQKANTVTLKVTNQTIEQVMETLTKRYDFTFVMLTPGIDTHKKVSISAKQQPISAFLKMLFSGQNVDFDIQGKTVRISRASAASQGLPAAQSLRISGRVTDAMGAALPGVNVIIAGTSQGTATDLNGGYSIEVNKPTDTLLFSFMGYLNNQQEVGNRSTIDVMLEESQLAVDEVVVVGYGVQKKKEVTGAVSTLAAKDIENIPVNDFGSALAGRAAGVQVVTPSGKPNAGFSIRVRGSTSISAGNEPLYVVDGVPTGDTKSISPAEIESITVLKDASSAAIYGNAGANGVVLITTKQGRRGDAKIELNAYYGLSLKPKSMSVLNDREYEELLGDLGYPELDRSVYNANVDWQDYIYRNAPMQNYQLSVSGGDEKSTYYISGGTIMQDGIIAPSEFNRMNFKINLDYKVKDWMKIGTNLSYSRINDVDVSDGNSETVVLQAITTPSVVGIRNANGTYPTLPFISSLENPLAGIDAYEKDYISNKLLGYLYGEIYFTKQLKLKTSIGLESGSSRYKEFLDPFSTSWGQNQKGQAKYNSDFAYKWINENLLTYSNSIGKHSFSALGGFIASRYEGEGSSTSIRGFSSNKLPILGAGTIPDKPYEYYGANSNVSMLLRGTYNYAYKYMLTVNFRADGSSKFGVNSRWGYFPSFSLGWRLTGEEFLSNVSWLDDLKLRVGWGQVGNDQVDDYGSYGMYGSGANYNIDGSILSGYYQGQVGNDKLRWEKTSQTNMGIDLSLIRGRVNITIDAYYKKTSDLLLMVKLPQTSGFDSGMQNVGSVTNKGLEFQVNTRNTVHTVRWTTDFNISMNRNKITDMAGSPAIFAGGLDKKISGNASIVTTGKSLGSFYGYKAVGVNPDNGRMMYKKADGMLIYSEGLNPDTDRQIIGCAQPKLLYGINNTISWRNIDLSIFIQGSYGNDIYNATRMFTEGMFDSRNQSSDVLMRWRRPGDYTTIPRAEKDKYPLISSRFIEDGSYVKLKNVKLSYTLPVKWTKRALMERVSIYASGDNLFTLTNYSGYDPEVNIGGGSTSAMGIDQGVFPHTKIFILGVNVVF